MVSTQIPQRQAIVVTSVRQADSFSAQVPDAKCVQTGSFNHQAQQLTPNAGDAKLDGTPLIIIQHAGPVLVDIAAVRLVTFVSNAK